MEMHRNASVMSLLSGDATAAVETWPQKEVATSLSVRVSLSFSLIRSLSNGCRLAPQSGVWCAAARNGLADARNPGIGQPNEPCPIATFSFRC